ncbi:SpoIIE family protein phosphatase [Streptomyces sp. NPDC091287]|uniref:SpoIIE family protein phosphatase n=1 Tax=Streptomyces sp. NPDC091287 TaxID=3365988 RepID=UPI0038224F2F
MAAGGGEGPRPHPPGRRKRAPGPPRNPPRGRGTRQARRCPLPAGLGDLLLLYIDGACEARPRPSTPPGELQQVFGDAELAAAQSGRRGLDAEATVKDIGAALADHHDCWASDDTALLALRVPPPS